MYRSIRLPWSQTPSKAEETYRYAGIVRTQGSIFLLPPDQSILIEAFNAPPRPKTRMSSGAVALCKHFERGEASSEHGKAHPFWPLPRGSNERKSEMAAEVLHRMLGDAQWKNVMMLHRGVAVYEIRNSLGYGMRWTLELEEVKGKEEEVMAQEMQPSLNIMAAAVAVNGEDESETVGSGQMRVNDDDDASKQWTVRRTLFRGLLEPIVGLDHELVGIHPEADPAISD